MTPSGNRTKTFAAVAKRSALLALSVFGAPNCKANPQATDGSISSDDSGPREMSDQSPIPQDSRSDVPTPPWYDGSWLIPTARAESDPPHACPSGATMLPSVLADRYYGGCEWNGYFLGPAFGPISLGLLGERSFWALGTQNRDLSGLGVCRSRPSGFSATLSLSSRI